MLLLLLFLLLLYVSLALFPLLTFSIEMSLFVLLKICVLLSNVNFHLFSFIFFILCSYFHFQKFSLVDCCLHISWLFKANTDKIKHKIYSKMVVFFISKQEKKTASHLCKTQHKTKHSTAKHLINSHVMTPNESSMWTRLQKVVLIIYKKKMRIHKKRYLFRHKASNF